MTGTVKKIIGVCLLIVVAALAWANFSYLPKWKKEQEAAFRAAIEKIPAKVRPDTLEFSSFDPSFFDRSVTIENLHFAKTSDEAVNYDIKMKRLQVKGIAIPPKGKGVEDIFDSASVEGMTMVFKAGDGISSEASYDMFSMKGFRADLDLINLAMRSDVTTTQITEALESISVKETRGEGQIGKSDTPFFSQTSSIKKFFGEDISLLGVKRAEYSGLSFKMNDEEFCSIDEMGMEELKMPRILSAIINIETDSMAFQNALSASPIELGKLYVKGLR